MIGGLQPAAGFAGVEGAARKLGGRDGPVATTAQAGQDERNRESAVSKPPRHIRAGKPKRHGGQEKSVRQQNGKQESMRTCRMGFSPCCSVSQFSAWAKAHPT